jgi:hypothetical protein
MAFSNFVLDRTTGFDDALAEGPDALGALAPEDKAASGCRPVVSPFGMVSIGDSEIIPHS